MEKAEGKWEQEEEEEEEETLRGRLPRNLNKIMKTVGDDVNGGSSIIMPMASLDPSECESTLTQEEEQEEEVPLEEGLKKTTTTTTIINNTATTTTTTTTTTTIADAAAVIESLDNGVPHENGLHQDPQKCVYYDHNEGIWKCQICCWTYQSGSVSIDHSPNPKWHLYVPMNDKNLDLQGSFFNCETEGIEFNDGYSGIEHNISECSGPEKNPGDDQLNVTVQKFNIQESSTLVINHQYEENLENDILPVSSIRPSEISSEEHKTSLEFSNNKAIKSADINLIGESDLELSEVVVERVIEKQNTHDLYCPNCNSCITRRVILRKRKRKIRIAGDFTKRNKLEATEDSGLDGISEHASNDQGRNVVDISGSQIPAANEYDHDREPELFRCLSCFSFFILIGNCFKRFRIFGDKSDYGSIQDSQQIPPKNRKWFPSPLASDKRKMLIEPGGATLDYSEENAVNQLNSSSLFEEVLPYHASDLPLPLGTLTGGTPVNNGESAENAILITRQDGKLQISVTVGSSVLEKSHMDQKPDEVTEKKSSDGAYPPEVSQHASTGTKVNIHTEERLKVDRNGLVSSAHDALLIQYNRADIAQGLKDLPAESGTVTDGAYPSEVSQHAFTGTKVNIQSEEHLKVDRNGLVSSAQGALLIQDNRVNIPKELKDVYAECSTDGAYPSEVSQHAFTGTKVDIHTGETVKVDKNVLISSVQDALLIQENRVNIAKELKDVPAESSTGKYTVINIEEGAIESVATQTAQNTIVSSETGDTPHTATQLQVVEQKGSNVRELHRVEIIKSIIYGGLIESITSLGVVSSAAGGDAATLNILALGLANLIGGLFIMCHDLWELKDHSGETTNQESRRGNGYPELLGRTQNFFIHATVAVLSFLIFGSLPPVMYGFTFRTSDNRDLKLVAVAAVSLLCIIVLSIGKVYVQRPPKSYIKTVLYYVTMGVVASGICYALGSLIKKLLEELGLFESSSIVTLPLLKAESGNPAWTSY